MRPETSELSSHQDRALGGALRAALDRPGDVEFLAAVLERARSAGVGSSWAVLRRPSWTRAAVAAAVLAALVGGILTGTAWRGSAGRAGGSQSFDDAWVTATTGNAAAGALFTAEQVPDASILFASVVRN